MNQFPHNDKLSSLRARTDHQLIALIRKDLVLGLSLAGQADAGERMRAERAWSEARRLLPLVDGIGDSEREHLSAQLQQLRLALDRSPAQWSGRLRAAGA